MAYKLGGISTEGVDPKLVDILTQGAEKLIQDHPGWEVKVISGLDTRASGSENHPYNREAGGGRAIDVKIFDENGKEFTNLGRGAGPAAVQAYKELADNSRTVQQSQYKELNDKFGWGGYFGPTKANPSGYDLMHYQTSGNVGRNGNWENGFTREARRELGLTGTAQWAGGLPPPSQNLFGRGGDARTGPVGWQAGQPPPSRNVFENNRRSFGDKLDQAFAGFMNFGKPNGRNIIEEHFDRVGGNAAKYFGTQPGSRQPATTARPSTGGGGRVAPNSTISPAGNRYTIVKPEDYSVSRQPLSRGMADPRAQNGAPIMDGQVRKLQQDLLLAGYNPGKLDGYFGPKTQAAAEALARDQGKLEQFLSTPAAAPSLPAKEASTGPGGAAAAGIPAAGPVTEGPTRIPGGPYGDVQGGWGPFTPQSGQVGPMGERTNEGYPAPAAAGPGPSAAAAGDRPAPTPEQIFAQNAKMDTLKEVDQRGLTGGKEWKGGGEFAGWPAPGERQLGTTLNDLTPFTPERGSLYGSATSGTNTLGTQPVGDIDPIVAREIQNRITDEQALPRGNAPSIQPPDQALKQAMEERFAAGRNLPSAFDEPRPSGAGLGQQIAGNPGQFPLPGLERYGATPGGPNRYDTPQNVVPGSLGQPAGPGPGAATAAPAASPAAAPVQTGRPPLSEFQGFPGGAAAAPSPTPTTTFRGGAFEPPLIPQANQRDNLQEVLLGRAQNRARIEEGLPPTGPQRLQSNVPIDQLLAQAQGPRSGGIAPRSYEDIRPFGGGATGPSSRDPMVGALQQDLKGLGLYTGDIDGRYGPLTQGAVAQFQRGAGLPVDGVAGAATRNALEQIRAGTSSPQSVAFQSPSQVRQGAAGNVQGPGQNIFPTLGQTAQVAPQITAPTMRGGATDTLTAADQRLSPPQAQTYGRGSLGNPLSGRGDIDPRLAGYNVMQGQNFTNIPFMGQEPLGNTRMAGNFTAPPIADRMADIYKDIPQPKVDQYFPPEDQNKGRPGSAAAAPSSFSPFTLDDIKNLGGLSPSSPWDFDQRSPPPPVDEGPKYGITQTSRGPEPFNRYEAPTGPWLGDLAAPQVTTPQDYNTSQGYSKPDFSGFEATDTLRGGGGGMDIINSAGAYSPMNAQVSGGGGGGGSAADFTRDVLNSDAGNPFGPNDPTAGIDVPGVDFTSGGGGVTQQSGDGGGGGESNIGSTANFNTLDEKTLQELADRLSEMGWQ